MPTTPPSPKQISFVSWQLDSEDKLPDKIIGNVNYKKQDLEDWIEKNLEYGQVIDMINMLLQNQHDVVINQLKHLGYEV